MVQSIRRSTAQGKWLTSNKPVPPCVASQPIPRFWFVRVLQLIVTGCPYFTTTLGGLTLMGQEPSSPVECIANILGVIFASVQRKKIFMFTIVLLLVYSVFSTF